MWPNLRGGGGVCTVTGPGAFPKAGRSTRKEKTRFHGQGVEIGGAVLRRTKRRPEDLVNATRRGVGRKSPYKATGSGCWSATKTFLFGGPSASEIMFWGVT